MTDRPRREKDRGTSTNGTIDPERNGFEKPVVFEASTATEVTVEMETSALGPVVVVTDGGIYDLAVSEVQDIGQRYGSIAE